MTSQTANVLNMRTDVESLETGIESAKSLAASLSACLADSYLLMVKTQAYHWNAVGPLFHSIHLLTEEHYTNLFGAVDELAERIRALGYPAPSSFTEMATSTGLVEDTDNPTTETMIGNLVADHQTVARRFRAAIVRAEDHKDVVTADMLTERIRFHEKAIWMLRAFLSR
ncbi:MAG: DNA starvation/stationary phase protection protein [Pseudomonadota bacterium]